MFYLLDKPKGISSFKAIRNFAKIKNIKKIGHTGTLDPLATGLLLIATDADTKLIAYVDKGFKRYKTTIEFGKISDTYDVTGEVKSIKNFTLPIQEQIEETFLNFKGKTDQPPPIYSAKRVNGQRAYKLARAGKNVNLSKNLVEMKNFKIQNFTNNFLTFEVTVSRGTYIRSLVNDLGRLLNCGAIMYELRRTEIGTLTEQDLNHEIDIEPLLTVPILSLENIDELKLGKVIPTKFSEGTYALKYLSNIVGIVNVKENKIKVKKLFAKKL